jgi:hypothetical protein
VERESFGHANPSFPALYQGDRKKKLSREVNYSSCIFGSTLTTILYYEDCTYRGLALELRGSYITLVTIFIARPTAPRFANSTIPRASLDCQ